MLPTGFENVSGEDINRALHEYDEVVERWNNRITLDNLNFVERYLKNEIGVCLVFGLEKCRSRQFIAIFQGKGRRCVKGSSGDRGILPRSDIADTSQCPPDGENCAMFVDNVESVYTEEGITLSSSVRLYAFDEGLDLRPDAGEKAGGSTFGFGEVGLIPMYWKVGFLNYGITNGAVAGNQNEGERVHGGPEIMNCIPDIGAQIGRDVFNDLEALNSYSRFRVIVGDRLVWMSQVEQFDLPLKVLQVFLCPFNFYPTREQWVHGKA